MNVYNSMTFLNNKLHFNFLELEKSKCWIYKGKKKINYSWLSKLFVANITNLKVYSINIRFKLGNLIIIFKKKFI